MAIWASDYPNTFNTTCKKRVSPQSELRQTSDIAAHAFFLNMDVGVDTNI